MKQIFLYLILFLGLNAKADLVLKLGQIQTLNRASGSLVVGSKKIIEVKNSGQIIAKKIGETTLSRGKNIEKVHVLSIENWQLWSQLKNEPTLKKHLAFKNGQLLWHGVLSLETFYKLEKLLQKSQGRLVLQVTTSLNEKPWLEKIIFKKLSSQDVQLTWEPYLQIQSTLSSEQIQKKLNGFEIPVINIKQKFENQPLVQTLVVMAEINRTESHHLGLEWPTSSSVELVPKLQGPDSLLTNIHALEAKGQGRVLAKPILICKSGSEAQFLAGGEFPIRIVSHRSKEVLWKQHGILLKIKPTVGLNQQINLEITSEISLLDKANAVEGVPALKTNRVQSEINVTNGQTLALSGLLREEFGNDHSGLFGLASLPVLGPLFRSENFLKSRSELVVFILPKIKTEFSNSETKIPNLENLAVPFDFE